MHRGVPSREAVLLGLLLTAPAAAAKAEPRSPATAPGRTSGLRVTGTVVDEAGRPLAGAMVRARTASMGRALWWAFQPGTRTDARGRFELPLPFAGIPYTVSARLMGHVAASAKITPEQGETLRLALRPRGDTHVIGGTVVDPAGRPAPDTLVRLIGEYGWRADARTNRAGEFALRGIDSYIGQAVPLVRAGGRVARLRIVRGKDKELKLLLVKPARLKGVVREKPGGRAVQGATVILRPWFASDFRMETTVGGDGRFELGGIPPGKYKVTAVAATHFLRPPRGMDSSLPETSLAPGEVREVTIEMQRVATARGRVLDRAGRGVAGALVVIRSTWLGDYRDQNRYVRTDGHGRFAIATGHTGERLPLVAYSGRHGLGRVQLPPLEPGQVHDGVLLTLPGAARVRGIVTGPAGRPIKGVVCTIGHVYSISATTGAGGRFDLGRVPCAPGARPKPPAVFHAPRPPTYSFDSVSRPVRSLETAPRFFHHRRLGVDLRPDRDLDLIVRLEPAQLLCLHGTVVDRGGRPIPGAKVLLLTGDANEANWRHTVSPVGMGGSLDMRRRATTLGATKTDDKGRWRFLTVRENGEAMPMGDRHTDWTRYCIGVATAAGNHMLVRNIVVPPGQTRLERKIGLAAAVPDVLAALRRVQGAAAGQGDRPALPALRELTGRSFRGADEALAWWWQEPLAPARPEEADLDAARLEKLWEALGGDVSARAYQDALALAGGGQRAAHFIAERLRPIPNDANHVRMLVGDLDHERYAVRRRAYEGLCRIGRIAAPALRDALTREPSEEMSLRAKELLAAWDRPYPVLPEARRAARALRVLALIGSPEAARTLETLARGMPRALLTEHAKAALRHAKRKASRPPRPGEDAAGKPAR